MLNKILLSCLSFREFTGSEMYVYELAKHLSNMNYDVTVASPYIGGKLTNLAINNKIKIKNLSDLTKADSYDIVHSQHKPVTEYLIKLFPKTKHLCSIHSEIISLEEPVIDNTIKHYIAIRPEIKNFLIKNFNIDEDIISVIYNPIDENKFKPIVHQDYNSVLFVGTLDYLRKNTIFDLINYSKNKNMNFWLVGENNDNYLEEVLKHKHVKYSKSVPDVEKYVQRCSETAGILLGRTTIEGWMCGKSGWIYDVDQTGKILNKNLHQPPDDIEKFYSSSVAKEIKKLY